MSNSTLDPTRTAGAQLPLRVDESRMATTYANAIRTSPTADEIVLDFGMSLPRTGTQTAQTLTIDSRVVLNWGNAKRLALSLAQMVQAHEQQYGEISLAPPAGPTARQ